MGKLLLAATALMTVLCGCHKSEVNNKAAQIEYQKIHAFLVGQKAIRCSFSLKGFGADDGSVGKLSYIDKLHYKTEFPGRSVISAGEALFIVHPKEKTFLRASAHRAGEANLRIFWGFDQFERQDVKPTRESFYYDEYRGIKAVVRKVVFEETNLTETLHIYYSRNTKLPLGYTLHMVGKYSNPQSNSIAYSQIEFNPKLDAKQFAFKPPADYKEKLSAADVASMAKNAKLANITLSDLKSQPFDSTKVLAANKGLLVFFWSHG